jgi:hypothetical protein
MINWPRKLRPLISLSTMVGTYATQAAGNAGLSVVASANPVVLGGGLIVGTVVIVAVIVNIINE